MRVHDRIRTILCMSGQGRHRSRPTFALAVVLLGLSGATLLTACSTVGAIPGVLLTPRAPAPNDSSALPASPIAPAASAVPSAVVMPSAAPLTAPDPTAYLATFTTRLAGSNEVPQNFSMGTGTVDALLDTHTGLLRWKLSYSNLSGAAVMGHFHGPAAIGANASVTLPFPLPIDSPYEGRATLTPQQMAELMAGKWYVNLHTAKYSDGEIRGQMIERR